MVHKKYIKRDGKTFGPYLYENYREDGVVKTRYLGKGKSGLTKNTKSKKRKCGLTKSLWLTKKGGATNLVVRVSIFGSY